MSRKPSASITSQKIGDNSFSDDDLLPNSSSVKPPVATPSKSYSSTPSANSTSIIKAFEANAFKTISGQYQLQGRFGLALLSSSVKLEFKLLIYASGNAVVTQALVNSAFQVTIFNRVYASFYDTFNQNWSFLFDNQEKVEDFVRQLTIAKFRSTEMSSIAFCDVVPGDGDKLSIGDSAEIKYTGWILQPNGVLGSVFETNNVSSGTLLRVKVGKSKTIKAWDDGLIDMQRGTRRFLAVPAKKAYGSKGIPPKVPPSSNIFFEVEVVRVRCHSQKEAAQPSLQAQLNMSISSVTSSNEADEQPLPLLPSDPPPEADIKERANSITEKLQDKMSSKQKLLSKMARMGQSMLPPPNKKELDSDNDSDINILDNDHAQSNSPPTPIVNEKQQGSNVKPMVVPTPAQPTGSIYQPSQTASYGAPIYGITSSNSAMPIQTMYNQPSNQLAPFSSVRPGSMDMYGQQTPQMYSNQLQQPTQPSQFAPNLGAQQPAFSDQVHNAMLVNETRQHNTEMRIAISKLQDKVDNVLNTVKDQKISENRLVSSTPVVPTMETTILLQNLTRIIQENEHLKSEVMQKSEKIEKQNLKISQLLERNQQILEEINKSKEQGSQSRSENASQSQNRVLHLEEQKLKLVQDLSNRTSEIYELQIQLDNLKKENTNTMRKFTATVEQKDNLQNELDNLKLKNNDLQNEMAQLKDQVKEFKQARKLLDQEKEAYLQTEAEMKQERLAAERTSKEKLRRMEDEKVHITDEFNTFKVQSEKELEELREKLRQERANIYSDTSLKQNIIEEEITERWKKRCDQLVKAEIDRFERRLAEMEEDKTRFETDYQTAMSKLATFKSQTREMKQNMMDEVNRLTAEIDELTDKLVIAQKSEATALTAVSKSSAAANDASDKIRFVMNNVYKTLHSKIAADKRYEGSRVHLVAKNIIRKTTLKIIGDAHSSDESESEEDADENESQEDADENESEEDANESEEDADENESEEGGDERESEEKENIDINYENQKNNETDNVHADIDSDPHKGVNARIDMKIDEVSNLQTMKTQIQPVIEDISSNQVHQTNHNKLDAVIEQDTVTADVKTDVLEQITCDQTFVDNKLNENEILEAVKDENVVVSSDIECKNEISTPLQDYNDVTHNVSGFENLQVNRDNEPNLNESSSATSIANDSQPSIIKNDNKELQESQQSSDKNDIFKIETNESTNYNDTTNMGVIPTQPPKPPPKTDTLFGDSDDDDIFHSNPVTSTKPQTTPDEPDQSANKIKQPLPAKPLFGDDDDDMSWLHT